MHHVRSAEGAVDPSQFLEKEASCNMFSLCQTSHTFATWPASSILSWNGSLLGSIEFEDKLGQVHLVWS